MKKLQLSFRIFANLALVIMLLTTSMQTEKTPVKAQEQHPEDLSAESGQWLLDIQQQLANEEYNITWQDETYLSDVMAAYQAPNREQNLRTYFSADGISVIPREWEDGITVPPWRWDLRMDTYGSQVAKKLQASGEFVVQDNILELPNGELVQWFRNESDGLQVGARFEIAPTDASVSVLQLVFMISTNMTSRHEGESALVFMDSDRDVLQLSSLGAHDANGLALPVSLALDGDIMTWQMDASSATYPVSVNAVVTGLPSTYKIKFIGSDTSMLGYSVATAGDVNNDGYSDLIIGLPYYDGGQTDEGRALIYPGGIDGLYAPPLWTKESDQAGAHFGFSVSTAGDVNSDFYCDVIVGAPKYDHPETNEGGAWVYHGSAVGVNSAPSFFAQADQADADLGWSVAFAGDVNRDGYSDIIVGAIRYDNFNTNEGWAMVWYGSATGINGGVNGTPSNVDWHAEGQEDSALLGISVATAGDVNGDEYFDIIVGASQFGNLDPGEAFVWYGGDGGVNDGTVGIPSNADWRTNLAYEGAHMGLSVASAGDVNADGFTDVIVGAPHYSGDTFFEEGAAFLYLGGEGGLSMGYANRDVGNKTGAWFAYSVATAGDVNGDGYADVVVGAPLYTNGQHEEGRAFLWYGNSTGISSTRDWDVESNLVDALYGSSVATAGDVNGDGFSDLVVGSPNENGSTGAAYVYLGSVDLPDVTANWSKRSNQESASFGFSAASAGDVNGDGFSDIIVGAYLWDDGQTNEGAVWVYQGSENGPVTAPYWYKQSDQANSWFGYAVASAGDVNGDAFSDVVVGAPYYESSATTDEGGVWVYHGSSSGVISTPAWDKTSDQANARFGFSVASAGDLNGDGIGDLVVGAPLTDYGQTDEGVAWIYLGSLYGLSRVPQAHIESNQTGAQLGYSVATAGDVNADGFSDLVIGSPYWEDDANISEGRAWLYHGSTVGLDTTPRWHAESNNFTARMGWSVACAGDVNGDGYSDVIIGAPYYGDDGMESEGKVWVYHGSELGLDSSASWSKESGRNVAYYGYSVASAGDVNGDGYADVLVSAPNMTPAGGVVNAGLVRLYTGGSDGLGSSYAWTGEGDQTTSWYGVSVASAGDVNGDAYADIIVGAHSYTGTEVNEGKILVYYGNGCNGFPIRLMINNLGYPAIRIHYLGIADPVDLIISFYQWSPFGNGDYREEFEAKPLKVTMDGEDLQSGISWHPLRPPDDTFDFTYGLDYATAYHWRYRISYKPTTTPWMPASRWVSVPLSGWNETKFRTIGLPTLYLPLIMK